MRLLITLLALGLGLALPAQAEDSSPAAEAAAPGQGGKALVPVYTLGETAETAPLTEIVEAQLDQYYFEISVTRAGRLVSDSQLSALAGLTASISSTSNLSVTTGGTLSRYAGGAQWIELTPPKPDLAALGSEREHYDRMLNWRADDAKEDKVTAVLEPLARSFAFAGIQGTAYIRGTSVLTIRAWRENSGDAAWSQADLPPDMSGLAYDPRPDYTYLGSATFSIDCPEFEPILLETVQGQPVDLSESPIKIERQR